MGYRIGVDFGTTNSTVALVSKSNSLEAFRYPGPEGYEYIPTCVAYEEDGSTHIGRAALEIAGDPSAVFCNNLKMVLPLSEEDLANYGWTRARSPESVIADYFRHSLLLDDDEASSFQKQRGQIDGVVLSVPHIWAKAVDHSGRSRLQHIVANILKLPLIQLISEPVAAAAYYAHRLQREHSEPFKGNLLVCDVGGGTFDVTLCRVTPGAIEELYNDGNGKTGMGQAGVFFDTKLILDKCEGLEEGSPKFHEFYNRLQDFKINQHATVTKNIITAIGDPDRRGMPIIKLGETRFDFQDIAGAFEQVEEGINEVLGRFKSVIDEHGYSVDALFFVGGFAQFYLVREVIKRFWDIEQNDPRFIEKANREISRYAIAYGAALVAKDLIHVEERYEHTIGIEGFRLQKRKDREVYDQVRELVPIIVGGQKLSTYEQVHFASNPIKVHYEMPEVYIYVDPESKNQPVVRKLPETLDIRLPNVDLPGNRWTVGMRINKSKVAYLVFRDGQGETVEYELGDVVRQTFRGVRILEDRS